MNKSELKQKIEDIGNQYFDEHPEERLRDHEKYGYRICWNFVGWWSISFGFHVSLKHRNFEIHLPFGYFRVGNQPISYYSLVVTM